MGAKQTPTKTRVPLAEFNNMNSSRIIIIIIIKKVGNARLGQSY